MKVIVYNIDQENKVLLALANRKKHKITIITYPLNETTADFAEAKRAVIIIDHGSQLSENLILKLLSLGVQYLIFRSQDHLSADLSFIRNFGLKCIVIEIADSRLAVFKIIEILDAWEESD
ncbi:Rossmann-fold NAD(P)-binding domain-containing protein [Chryseobacterium limigenitum]|uniref:Uncharacterized protein n=1 Tax=Chryseobacterium limigenitum TaxID=1612149 RepID=A0A1K2IJ07_9FLAO|nr:hypothetical protein [Chryseobacterium limigenitum]SFZ92417.1 hypothetical protein SAMN05216324_103258 [Chryseobacterium limigenitum]